MLETTEKLRGFINENFLYGVEVANLKNDTSLMKSGYVDSAGIMEVVGYVENTFNITIDDEDLMPDNFDSLDGIANFITRKKMELLQ